MRKRNIQSLLVLALLAIGGLMAGPACSVHRLRSAVGLEGDAVEIRAASASSGSSATELWENNCTHCHNLRTPSSYSDAEWDVAVHHMRVRANLTAEEAAKIASFLKSSN